MCVIVTFSILLLIFYGKCSSYICNLLRRIDNGVAPGSDGAKVGSRCILNSALLHGELNASVDYVVHTKKSHEKACASREVVELSKSLPIRYFYISASCSKGERACAGSRDERVQTELAALLALGHV